MDRSVEVDDPYRELGITQEASDAQVKAAWRRMAATWHPDRNHSPAAVRKIQRINRALEEIRSARERARADRGVTPGPEPAAGPAGAGADPPAADAQADAAPGAEHTVSLTLEEAFAGCVKTLQGEVIEDCAACAAEGVTPAVACPACAGAGQLRQPLWFGWLSAPVECDSCQGRGQLRPPCGACAGSGKAAPRPYRCRARIPPGLRGGEQLRVPARPLRGGAPGMLLIHITLRPHAFFALDEDGSVRCEIPVDGFAWMASRWVEVPTPSGPQQMRLQRGHLVYRIKGQGFPPPGPGRPARADCLVTVLPLFPERLSARQEAQVDRLIAVNSGDPATPVGQRAAAWEQSFAAWREQLPPGPGGAAKA